jgi:hypothetical protein
MLGLRDYLAGAPPAGTANLQGISAFNVAGQSRRPIIRGRPGDAVDWTELNTEVQASMVAGQQSAAFRACPKCGSERYTQRPVRL